ncbi:TIGR02452 family protein [Lawsonibacter asaccharolyticus]
MGREENIQVFEDTQQKCRSDSRLIQAIAQANAAQRLILESDSETWKPACRYMRPAQVIVSRKRTLEAASAYIGKKVCVLNFASATNPGGGVTRGSSAQEEAICRCSSLYFNLREKRMWEGFYAPHRAQKNPLHNDDCIYTPGVVVFKSDTAAPQALPPDEWYTVNVLTCAAPNLRERPGNRMNDGGGVRSVQIGKQELRQLHEKRMRRILSIAASEGNEVMILGAFGCGAFSNPPDIVAEAMKTVVQEYRSFFEAVEFAVYCPPRDDSNYRVFERVLGRI